MRDVQDPSPAASRRGRKKKKGAQGALQASDSSRFSLSFQRARAALGRHGPRAHLKEDAGLSTGPACRRATRTLRLVSDRASLSRLRSEEGRAGKTWVRTCRYRGLPAFLTK